MYNPIVGIYELKRFMGLRDLPKPDHRIARVLRYFNSKNEEKMINVDETPVKFWENFWCSYSDCVFVDLNAHKHDHTLFVDTSKDLEHQARLRIDMSYKLKVSDPVKVVEDQITDTDRYMKSSIDTMLRESIGYGDPMDEDRVEAAIRKNIASSGFMPDIFSMSDLMVSVTYENDMQTGCQDEIGSRLNNDMNTLLEIAKNSNLDESEEEELKKLILNGPD